MFQPWRAWRALGMKAKLTFYNIDKLGFYKRGLRVPEFGGGEQSLSDLVKWAKDGRGFENTTTFQPDPEKDVYRTFFCNWGASADKRDGILVLWNEHPNNDGKIYGYDTRSRPGSTHMVSRDFSGSRAIPGLPSYFWFATDLNILASIRLHYSYQGKGNLDRYINGYLANFSPYRVKGADGEIIGYSKTGAYQSNCDKVYPRFATHATKNTNIREVLLSQRSEITKIVKRETFSDTVEDRRQDHERFFSGLTRSTPSNKGETTITQIMNYTPTETELEEIISKYENHDLPREVTDVGFYLKSNKKIMLSGITFSTSEDINIPEINNAMHSPEQLLNALPEIRNRLALPAGDQNQEVA